MSRLGGVRRLAVRGDDKGLLQGRGRSEHNTRPDNRMTLELLGQSFQEGVALQRVDRRGRRLNSNILVITEAERGV